MANPIQRFQAAIQAFKNPNSGYNSANFGDNINFSLNTPIPFGGPAIYPNPNALRFIQDGYSGNATVYTIVSKISRKFGMLPRYVYEVEDKSMEQKAVRLMKNMGVKVQQKNLTKLINYQKQAFRQYKTPLERKAYNENIVESPLSELLFRPNEWQGQDAFFELLATYYLITGEAFIWLNRGDIEGMLDENANKMPVLEMFVLPSQWMEILPDQNDVWGVAGYYFQIGGIRRFIRKDDVIHWRMPNPNFEAYTRRHLRGFSPLDAGNKLLTQDESATDASVALEQNLGSRGVMFDKTLKLTPTQASQVKKVMDEKVNSKDLRGNIAQIQGDWGYIDLSMTAIELDLENAKSSVFKRICNLYGISPDLFMAGTTYENTIQAIKDLITGVCFPMACSLKDEMNRVLLPAFGLDPKKITHDVDISDLSELQEDQEALTTRNVQKWWTTPNQKLASEGEEESTDPLMDKIWVANNLVLMDDAGMSDQMPTDSFDPSKPDFSKNSQNGNQSNLNGKDKSNGNGILPADKSKNQ